MLIPHNADSDPYCNRQGPSVPLITRLRSDGEKALREVRHDHLNPQRQQSLGLGDSIYGVTPQGETRRQNLLCRSGIQLMAVEVQTLKTVFPAKTDGVRR